MADELFSPEIAELENFIDSYVGNNSRTFSSSSLSQSPTKSSGLNHRTSSSNSKVCFNNNIYRLWAGTGNKQLMDSQLDRLSSTESKGSSGQFIGNRESEDFILSFQDELLLHQRDQNLNYDNKINSAFMSMRYQQSADNEPGVNNATHALAMQLRAARDNYENEIRPHIQIQENRGMNSYYQQQQAPPQQQQQYSPIQWDQQQMYYQQYPSSEPNIQQQQQNVDWNQQMYKPQTTGQMYINPGQVYQERTTFPSVTAAMPIANASQQQQHMGFPEWVDVSKPPPMWSQQAGYIAPVQNYQPAYTPPLPDGNNYAQVAPISPQPLLNHDSGISSPVVSKTQSPVNSVKQKSPITKTNSKSELNTTNNQSPTQTYQSRTFKRSTSSSSNTSANHQRKSSSGRYSIGDADKDENWRETCKQNRQLMNGNEPQKDDQSSVFSDKSDKSEGSKARRRNKAEKKISNDSASAESNESHKTANPKIISSRSKANIKNILGGNSTNINSRNRDNNLTDKMHAMTVSSSEAELHKFIETAQSYSTNEAKMREVAEIVCTKAIGNPMFGRKAALLCQRMSSYMAQGTKFRSVVLNIMQGHYRNCQQFLSSFHSSDGKDTRFLGYMTFLSEFFVNVTTKNGEPLKVLNVPLYKCLMMVITLSELNRHLVDCFTSTLELSGKLLESINRDKMSDLMSEVRNQCIVSPNLPKILKRELLRTVEVYSGNWSVLTNATQQYYETKIVNEHKQPKTKQNKSTAVQRK